MPKANARPVVLCDDAPMFEYRNGMFYGVFPSGDHVESKAFPPSAFLRSLRSAQEAVNVYFAERENSHANVVPIGH